MYKREHVLVETDPWSSDTGVRLIQCVPGTLETHPSWGLAKATKSQFLEGGSWVWELVIHL